MFSGRFRFAFFLVRITFHYSVCYSFISIRLFNAELGDIGFELPIFDDFHFVNPEIKIQKVNLAICLKIHSLINAAMCNLNIQ